MTTLAFTDGTGYYQCDVEDGVPKWAEGLTPCDVQQPYQPDQKDVIRSEIESLERQQLMPRATREFMILFMETQFTAEMLAENPGYQAVKAFDVLITGKRSEMALL